MVVRMNDLHVSTWVNLTYIILVKKANQRTIRAVFYHLCKSKEGTILHIVYAHICM